MDVVGRYDVRSTGWRPVKVLDLELSTPLPGPVLAEGERHRTAQVLVRLHGRPLGTVELPAEASADEQAARISGALGAPIAHHLSADGLEPVDGVAAAGLPCPEPAPCDERRRARLATPPEVTVLVATRDRTRELAACIDSVLDQDYPGSFDVVVTDSAPRSDATRELVEVRHGRNPRVRYVRVARPGLAVAHNHGRAHATGEVIAITDDDVVVDRGWLSALVEAFREVDGVGCVTGLILPFELETPAQMLVEQYGGFSRGFDRRVYSLGAHRPDDPLFPYTAGRLGSGANMAFDAATLRAIGGFDPALGAGTPARGGDDLAAFVQVLLSGRGLVYQPDAVVWHRHRPDDDSLVAMAQGYGVGLGAYLTSVLVSRPSVLFDMARRAPRVPSYLLRSDSPKNQRKGRGFPPALTRTERLGMVRGPAAYVRSRRRAR